MYVSWSTYIIVLGMIKISLVLFYLEIFKTRKFRVTACIVLGYLIVNSVVIFLIAILPCIPISAFWNRDIKGRCINIQGAAYAISASSIVQDIILLVLPLVFIRNLQMKRYRKLAVGFMFAIGTFGCFATIMRIPSLSTFKISIDPSWDYVPVTIWTELELAAGFICVSLPSIRMLLVTILPKRVKNFLSNITQPSRSRSGKRDYMPQQAIPPQQRKWSTPKPRVDNSAQSTNTLNRSERRGLEPLTLGSGVRDTFMSAFWSRSHTRPAQLSQSRIGLRRLESAVSSYGESDFPVARPPCPHQGNYSAFEQVEMLSVPMKSHRHASALEEQITALSQIGCVPDGSYSDIDVTTGQPIIATQWQRHGNDIV